MKLVPNNDATTATDVEGLVRLHHARDGMNRTEAQVLRTVLQGGDSRSLQGNSQQVALGRLRNAGYITRDETPALTTDVLDAFIGAHAGPPMRETTGGLSRRMAKATPTTTRRNHQPRNWGWERLLVDLDIRRPPDLP